MQKKKKKGQAFIVALSVFNIVPVSRTYSVLRMWMAAPEAEQGLRVMQLAKLPSPLSPNPLDQQASQRVRRPTSSSRHLRL